MDAGRLKKRVTIQRPRNDTDAAGDTASEWIDVACVWAAVEPLSGREWFAAQQHQSSVTHRVTIRYRRGIEASWRVLLDCRALYIDGPPIDERERHEWLTLMCVEAKP